MSAPRTQEGSAPSVSTRRRLRIPPPILRTLPLVYTVVHLLVLGGQPAGARDWVLSLVSAAALSAGARFPLIVLAVQAPLMLVAVHDTVAATHLVPLFASVALAELVFRTRGLVLWCGLAGAGIVVGVLTDWSDPTTGLLRVAIGTGGPAVVGQWLRVQRANTRHAEERAAEAERLRQVREEAVRTEERAGIARELHDVVAHHVASIALRVNVARHVSAPDTRTTEVFDDVHATATAALADLRRLVTVLRGPHPLDADDGPGSALTDPAALEGELHRAVERARGAGLDVTAEIAAPARDMDAVCGLAILRLVQEGLTNVLKHAGPGAAVRLVLREDGSTDAAAVLLEITDDGGNRGDTDRQPHPTEQTQPGHGLVGMTERVGLVGGHLSTGPHGDGWRLRAELPLAVERNPT